MQCGVRHACWCCRACWACDHKCRPPASRDSSCSGRLQRRPTLLCTAAGPGGTAARAAAASCRTAQRRAHQAGRRCRAGSGGRQGRWWGLSGCWGRRWCRGPCRALSRGSRRRRSCRSPARGVGGGGLSSRGGTWFHGCSRLRLAASRCTFLHYTFPIPGWRKEQPKGVTAADPGPGRPHQVAPVTPGEQVCR